MKQNNNTTCYLKYLKNYKQNHNKTENGRHHTENTIQRLIENARKEQTQTQRGNN